MEIILEGIDFDTLTEIYENYSNNIKGFYVDKESDLYNIYLKDVTGVKISDDYTLITFHIILQSYRPAKKLRNNEYVRIIIQ